MAFETFMGKFLKFPSIRKISSVILWSLALVAVVFYCVASSLLAMQFFEALLSGDTSDKSAEVRNIGLVLATFFGVPLVIWRSKIAYDQTQTAQERMITDRFSKAVDQLGAVRRVPQIQVNDETGVKNNWEEEQPNIEVRLGGIYTLQRISEDSLSDHIRVVETLCAYVRLNTMRLVLREGDVESGRSDIDIQAAIKVLGERSYERCVHEINTRVSLNLASAVLIKSNLNSLSFPFVDFENADLRYTSVRYTDFRQAWLGRVNFQYSDFHNCCLDRASLRGADLSNTNVTPEMLNSAHGVRSGYGKTELPTGMEPPMHWLSAQEADKESEALRDAYFRAYSQYLDESEKAWVTSPESQIEIDEVRLAR